MNSIDDAIDHLLSLEVIRQAEHNGYWSEDDPVILEKPDHVLGFIDVASKSKAKRGRRKEKPSAIPLVDTMQRRPTPSSSRTSTRAASREASPSRPSSNTWANIASLSAQLSYLLPYSETHFLTFLHSPKYHSVISAVRASLEALPAAELDERSRSILNDIFAVRLLEDPGQVEDLNLCVRVAGEVSVAIDLADLLDYLAAWSGDRDADVFADVPNVVPANAARSTPSTPLVSSIPMTPTSSAGSIAELLPSPARLAPHAGRLLDRPTKANGDVKSAKIIPGSQSPASAALNPTAMDNFGLPSSYSPLLGLKSGETHLHVKQVHPQNWRKVDHTRHHRPPSHHPLASNIPSYARGITPHDRTPGSLYRLPGVVVEGDAYYAKADVERLKRQRYMHEAVRHASSHLPGGKANNAVVAAHWAAQAREAQERMRAFELQGARANASNQFQRSSGGSIDLHHLTVEQGKSVASEMVQRWYDSQRASYGGVAAQASARQMGLVPAKHLTIVTGIGFHSPGQKGVLGPAVAAELRKGGWRVDDDTRGILIVKGKR